MTIDDVDEESAGVGDEAGAVDTNAEDLTAVAPRAAPISNFYLGSLVLKPNSPTDYDIYDGLQRITTLAILFSVLRDRIADEARKARLAALVVSASGAPRLVHTGHDTTLATMVQAPGQAIKTGAPRVKGEKILRPRVEYGRRIYDVTRSMVLALENHSQEQLTCLADYLFESVSVCIIETTDSRIARHIFVASNLYGLPLRRDEVLKGQFLALARDEAMEGQIERTWTDLREVVGRESFEDFLIAFDCIWRKRSQGADCLGDLVDHIAQSSNPKELINVLRALKRYAVAWQKLHEYLVRPNGGPLGNHVWRLRFFNWKEWQPLALIWIARYLHDMTDGRNKKQAHIRFAGLHNRCMLMTLYEYDAQQRADRFLRAVKVALEEPKKGARADSNIPFSKNASRLRSLDFSNDVRTRVKNDLLLPILNGAVWP